MKNCFKLDLKKYLITYLVELLARRPKQDMFAEKVFECYSLEINILRSQRQLLGILF
jgi:hypothetical protein